MTAPCGRVRTEPDHPCSPGRSHDLVIRRRENATGIHDRPSASQAWEASSQPVEHHAATRLRLPRICSGRSSPFGSCQDPSLGAVSHCSDRPVFRRRPTRFPASTDDTSTDQFLDSDRRRFDRPVSRLRSATLRPTPRRRGVGCVKRRGLGIARDNPDGLPLCPPEQPPIGCPVVSSASSRSRSSSRRH